MPRIRIRWPSGQLVATLDASPTAAQLLAALPVSAAANTWGEEVYFQVPFKATLEPGAKQVVEPGTVCFWVEGSALALPYGPTPASRGSECRLVARVNLLGRIEGDPRLLASVADGDPVSVEKV